MACFLVPTAEAVAVTAVKKHLAHKAKTGEASEKSARTLVLVRKLNWLTNLLWGGAVLLMFEHFWHGEVVPYFPFLTAAANPDDARQMLFEMSTVGVGMAVLVTVVWAVGLAVIRATERRGVSEMNPKA